MDMSLGNYSFVAIKGWQGKHTYYLIQCPLRLFPRLFLFDETEVPVPVRRGRTIDSMRVAEITKYLTEESETFVLPPILATISEKVTFEPIREGQDILGQLSVPMTAQLILQDGQHRRLAIQQILSKSPALGEDTIPVMLFADVDVKRSQRIYAALNNTQVKNTRSKRVLYEQSDMAALVQQLIDEVPLFQGRVELEKTTISNRSTALFTLSAIYQANEALLDMHKADQIQFDDVEIARSFWVALSEIIPEWQKIAQQELTAAYLRQNYVHSHTVMLIALAKAGHELIKAHPHDWLVKLRALGRIDWLRTNTALWEGRAMVLGRMSKATNSIKLSAGAIKSALGLPLTVEDQELEKLLASK